MVRFEIFDAEGVLESIAHEWSAIVARQDDVPYGLGPTSSHELATLAWKTHVPEANLHVVVAKDEDKVVAIVPGFLLDRQIGPVTYKSFGLLPDLYPGRTGIICESGQTELLQKVFGHLLANQSAWGLFEITHVAGSSDEKAFLEQVSASRLSARLSDVTTYPYVRFPTQWDDLLESFSKKFRYNIRSREKKLSSEGDVQVTCFSSSEDVARFLSEVESVERESWKETAGTSLTRNPKQHQFHQLMAPVCAANGTLRGYIMYLDGEPIAHIIGLYANHTFYCLKSSFADQYRKYSPGVVLKATVMRELIGDGAQHWDFVGPAEDHKMQWTNSTYILNRYTVYSRSFIGRTLQLRNRIGRKLRGDSSKVD